MWLPYGRITFTINNHIVLDDYSHFIVWSYAGGGGVGLIIKILVLSCRLLRMPVAEQLLC